MKAIDLRSDTVTRPSAEMRAAEVGDDVLGDVPTVLALQVSSAGVALHNWSQRVGRGQAEGIGFGDVACRRFEPTRVHPGEPQDA